MREIEAHVVALLREAGRRSREWNASVSPSSAPVDAVRLEALTLAVDHCHHASKSQVIHVLHAAQNFEEFLRGQYTASE